MAKSDKQTARSPKPRLGVRISGFVHRHRVIAGILALVVLGFVIYWGLVAYERYQFAQAEKKLDKLALEVNSALAPYGRKLEKDRYCVYSSATYSKGTLGCSVYYVAILKELGTKQSTELGDSLAKRIENSSVFINTSLIKSELPFTKEFDEATITDRIISYTLNGKDSSPSCTLDLSYNFVPHQEVPGFTRNQNESTKVLMGCHSSPRKAYFPVRE